MYYAHFIRLRLVLGWPNPPGARTIKLDTYQRLADPRGLTLARMKKQGTTLLIDEPAPVAFPSTKGQSSNHNHHGSSCFSKHNYDQVAPVSGIISDIVTIDILPQLRNWHRDRGATSERFERSPAEHVRLARSLLADRIGFRDMIAGHLAAGSPWLDIASSILGPAARGLGILWSKDACDLLEVTAAMGWLQAMTHALHRSHGCREDTSNQPRILLAPAPGEVHRYGLSLVSGFFRDAGWTTTAAFHFSGEPIRCLAATLEAEWFDALGLSLACDVHLPAIFRAIPLLRCASRNPNLQVIVGGPLIARGGADAAALGVDACITAGHAAPGVATELVHAAVSGPTHQRAEAELQPFL